jgi:predicted metal-dependent peptidase
VKDPQRQKAEDVAMDRTRQALRLASASLPHLSGLARLVRIRPTRQVAVAAIAPSGLMLIQPDVFALVPLGEAAFVLAHELMHLALDTHSRQGETNRLLVNFAHDYIINDMLREELGRDPPLDGLDMPGAREKSLEELCVELGDGEGRQKCWNPHAARGKRRRQQQPRGSMTRALEEAGLVEKEEEEDRRQRPDRQLSPGDLLPEDREEEFEPEISKELRQRLREEVKRAAAKAASLAELRKKMDEAGQPGSLSEPQRGSATMRALRDAYAPPWELAMQRWMDAVAPGERTYARPSRRGADRSDLVRPGRRRQGWTLHIVLDTSGSMVDFLPRALGAIAAFCDAGGVGEVRVVQCDIEVTSDRWVEPPELAEFQVAGFGYSDMSPGLLHLAEDPEVEAALLLTDGYIEYPAEPMPYRLLWGLIGQVNRSFNPPYGEVLNLPSLEVANS